MLGTHTAQTRTPEYKPWPRVEGSVCIRVCGSTWGPFEWDGSDWYMHGRDAVLCMQNNGYNYDGFVFHEGLRLRRIDEGHFTLLMRHTAGTIMIGYTIWGIAHARVCDVPEYPCRVIARAVRAVHASIIIWRLMRAAKMRPVLRNFQNRVRILRLL